MGAYAAEFLSVVRHTEALRAEWPSLRCWEQFAPFVDDRMCRQLLNIAHCVRRAVRQADVDWLLHLDHDELFLPPPHGLQEHVGRGWGRLADISVGSRYAVG